MSGPVDVLLVAFLDEQAELAVAHAMASAPGDSKRWEESMRDATDFRNRAALARIGSAS